MEKFGLWRLKLKLKVTWQRTEERGNIAGFSFSVTSALIPSLYIVRKLKAGVDIHLYKSLRTTANGLLSIIWTQELQMNMLISRFLYSRRNLYGLSLRMYFKSPPRVPWSLPRESQFCLCFLSCAIYSCAAWERIFHVKGMTASQRSDRKLTLPWIDSWHIIPINEFVAYETSAL